MHTWWNNLTPERLTLFHETHARIANSNPTELKAIESHINTQVLLSFICKDTEFLATSRYTPSNWTGTIWQTIITASRDLEDARWWYLAFVIETALTKQQVIMPHLHPSSVTGG